MILEKFEFPNAQGLSLAAALDRPARPPRAWALFAHCFTCGKDALAGRRIALALAERGFGVVRFDFTGLGASEGEFANTGFSSNVADLRAAAAAMAARGIAPSLLVGHSLGGAAVLAAAGALPEVSAVATIAAPLDPAHVLTQFGDGVERIRRDGSAEVRLAGRPFRIRSDFLDDVAAQALEPLIGELRKALLVFHSPQDEVVGVDNAGRIFAAARHPKSFVSLDGADHLLSRPADAAYVGAVLAAAVERYLPPPPEAPVAAEPGLVVVAETGGGRFQQVAAASGHRWLVDEPAAVGGLDSGPTPYDQLLAGLGACTAMTMRLYADGKGWPLRRAEVRLRHGRVHADDCRDADVADCRLERVTREIVLEGPLDAEQRARLLEIANRCPVHRTLTEGVRIETRLFDEAER